MPNPYFIDCHCHLFNIEDIPLYATLANVERLPNALLALGVLFGQHKEVLDKKRSFIDYFDRQRKINAKWLRAGMHKAAASIPDSTNAQRIATPLIMDFDEINGVIKDEVYYQTKRLRDDLIALGDEIASDPSQPPTKFLPFVGIDLRKVGKWSQQMENCFDSFLKNCGGLKDTRSNPDALANGDIIGIKLYPPIGFNPAGSHKGPVDANNLAFYEMCIKKGLPITVHCQPCPGSYIGHDMETEQADANTRPENWLRIFQALGQDKANKLKINFAHFGGEDEVAKAVSVVDELAKDVFHEDPEAVMSWAPSPPAGPRSPFPRNNWTTQILLLLKTYKNTYADLAAFDYTNEKAVIALAWILTLEERGELDSCLGLSGPGIRYSIKDKLLWGSDIPMILGKEKGSTENYEDYFSCFAKAMKISALEPNRYHAPSEGAIPEFKDIISRLTCINPKRFLFDVDAA